MFVFLPDKHSNNEKRRKEEEKRTTVRLSIGERRKRKLKKKLYS
jgi:hypothetical protein